MISLHIAAAILAVSGTGDTVLLNFSAPWCGHCRQTDTIASEMVTAGYPVQKVDFDQQPELARRYRVQAVPTFVLLHRGQEVARLSGGQTSQAQLIELFKRVQNTPIAAPPEPQPIGSFQLPPRPTDRPLSSAMPASFGSSAAGVPAVPMQGNNSGDSLNSPQLQQMMQSSVRIRVHDQRGSSTGSGTIIDSRAGEALVLTCAHLFRDSAGAGKILVDLFDKNGQATEQQLAAEMIDFDLTADVALISIRIKSAVTVANVAPRNYKPRSGDPVINIGCSHGNDPTIRQSKITSIDRYKGPPNIQVAGKSVQGRSGGGLFTAEGLVVGVCNAADEVDDEGLYAGLASIHAQLDRMSLSYVYHPIAPGDGNREDTKLTRHDVPATGNLPGMVPVPAANAASVASNSIAANPNVPAARQPLFNSPFNTSASGSIGTSSSQPPATAHGLSPKEAAALAAITNKAAGSEVVVIIRPSENNPQGKSEVIMLDEASPAFRQHLLSAMQSAP